MKQPSRWRRQAPETPAAAPIQPVPAIPPQIYRWATYRPQNLPGDPEEERRS